MPSLSVLVVEDTDVKFAAISDVLGRQTHAAITIERARDIGSARRALRKTMYDLLILDIAVPTLEGREAAPDGGLQLLEELEERAHLRMPTHIVGLTAFEEVYDSMAPRFARRAVSLLKYDTNSFEWADALLSRVWFAARSSEEASAEVAEWGTSLCIVCALQDPELRAVLSNGWQWTLDRRPRDPTIYYRAKFKSGFGEHTAVAAASSQMGMTAAAALAMKMAMQYRPEFLAMAGITAAKEGRASLGDVLVANPTWDWGAGKIVGDEQAGTEYLHAPSQLPLHAKVRERLQYLSSEGAVLDEIRRAWPDAPSTVLRVLIGPVASGSAVVEDEATMERIERQQRKLLGVEMEGYAVHVAAEEAPEPQPTAFVVKSVVDFAVPGKGDQRRSYAAFTSARVLTTFAEKYLWGELPTRVR